MSDLDELKNLLFGAEKQALDTIAARVESREVRAADVADILPEAIHQSHTKSGELVESLTEPVGECLQTAFRNDPETYGNALYPVIGPAIRKSIMHALRGFAQQINEAVEHSISPKGLKWRIQATRAGIPFGEFVMQKTLLYRVEQAYLISRENGLLMSHVHHEASKIKDSDAVSAMFTAIQDFVKESFSPDRTGRLESADMGDFTLWAVHGPHALLVCVIRGIPPRSLRDDLSAILERIHFRHGDAIREYRGDTSSVANVEEELERCLRFQARQEARSSGERRPAFFLLFLAMLMVAGAAWFLFQSWSTARQLGRLESALLSTPGVHISDLSYDGGKFHIRGLQDPLATPVEEVVAGVEIPPDRLVSDMQPFQSLDPAIIERRAELLLQTPATVGLAVDGNVLRVHGSATTGWRRQLETRFRGVAGIETLDTSDLSTNEPVQVDERQDLEQLVRELDGARFYFSSGVTLRDGDLTVLQDFAGRLGNLSARAQQAGMPLRIHVLGSTDRSGNDALNERLATDRAEAIARTLRAQGVVVDHVGRAGPGEDAESAILDPDQRFARVDLIL